MIVVVLTGEYDDIITGLTAKVLGTRYLPSSAANQKVCLASLLL